MQHTFDQILEKVGPYGKYQKTRIAVLIFVSSIITINAQYLFLITLYSPKYHCFVATDVFNETDIDTIGKCATENVTCSEWTYEGSIGLTMVNEYDLVCDRAVLRSALLAIQAVMQQIGNIFFGNAADRFGRKRLLIICCIWWVGFGLLASFVYNFWAVFVFSALASAVGNISFSIAQTAASEILLADKRPLICAVFLTWYNLYSGLMGAFFYLIGNWRTATKTIGFGSLTLVPLLFFCDESPRWLLTGNKKKAAAKIVTRMNKVNQGTEPDADLRTMLDSSILRPGNEKKHSKSPVVRILTHREMLKKTIILIVGILACQSTAMGTQMGVDLINANPYILFIVLSVSSAPATLASGELAKRFGRVWMFSGPLLAAGVATAVTGGLPENFVISTTAFCMLGRACVFMCFTSYYILVAELYPTETRSSAHAVIRCSVGVLYTGIPFFFFYLADHFDARYLPFVILAVTCMLGALFGFFLPEPGRSNMTDYAKDSEETFPVLFSNFARNICYQERKKAKVIAEKHSAMTTV